MLQTWIKKDETVLTRYIIDFTNIYIAENMIDNIKDQSLGRSNPVV